MRRTVGWTWVRLDEARRRARDGWHIERVGRQRYAHAICCRDSIVYLGDKATSYAGPSAKPPPSYKAFSKLQFSHATSTAQIADENDVILYDSQIALDEAGIGEDDEKAEKVEEKVLWGGWLEDDDIEDA